MTKKKSQKTRTPDLPKHFTEHVGELRQRLFVVVGRRGGGNDLDVVVVGLGKERPQRAVDEPRGQDGRFAGAAFAPEKAAGDAAGSVQAFFKVHGQREKVDPFSRRFRGGGGAEHHRVAEAHHYGCLLYPSPSPRDP